MNSLEPGRITKFKFKRKIKDTKSNVGEVGAQTAEKIDRHLVRRWRKFVTVRRFIVGWLSLVTILTLGVLAQRSLLAGYYQSQQPAAGGAYVEGIVGEITNLNPMFSTTAPDKAASKLIFSGLVKYDETSTITPDLARSWEVNDDETIYTFYLKDDIYWHDGIQFTAADVKFTFDAIQHPDSRTPLNQSWQDIAVQTLDDFTVTFTLPNSFPPFVHSLEGVGILPNHLLGELPPNELRAAKDFNLNPIGTGPFRFEELFLDDNEGQINLFKSEEYRYGAPQLTRFIIKAYTDHETMIEDFKAGELSAMAGIRTDDFDELGPEGSWTIYDMPLFNNTMAFFNNTNPKLEDADVRKALVLGTNRDMIFETLKWRSPATTGPLISGQLGYDPKLRQPKFNPDRAKKLLDEAGWKLADDGLRYKKGELLQLDLVSQNADEYPNIVAELQKQWRKIGVQLNSKLVSREDLQQAYIIPHSYDILLIGVSIGVDPDVYVYWHSSQSGVGGFNLSEYKNSVADEALEAGRTRLDEELRTVKYETFQKQWIKDNPALALYRPTFHYVQLNVAKGFDPGNIVEPSNRYANVHTWTINTEILNKPY
jgi:peptide/nickel transport system substrate-binding protein